MALRFISRQLVRQKPRLCVATRRQFSTGLVANFARATRNEQGFFEAPLANGASVALVEAFQDNYIYIVKLANGQAVCVDPGDVVPTLRALNAAGDSLRLTHILATHHHGDHIGGVTALKQATNCKVVAGKCGSSRIPSVDIEMSNEQTLALGDNLTVQMLEVPGHTRDHCAFYLPNQKAVCVGDTLFSLGCGRLFEGTPQQMQRSLTRLSALPHDTLVLCGHEYTVSNAEFALKVEPRNPALQLRAQMARELRKLGLPTLPVTLREELATNPFLRVNSPAVRAFVGMSSDVDPADVFGALRKAKDEFKSS